MKLCRCGDGYWKFDHYLGKYAHILSLEVLFHVLSFLLVRWTLSSWVIPEGFPGRSASFNPSIPFRENMILHYETVSLPMPSETAISPFVTPLSHQRTIFDLRIILLSAQCVLVIISSSRLSSGLRTIFAEGLPILPKGKQPWGIFNLSRLITYLFRYLT